MRSILKRTAERALLRSGFADLAGRCVRGRGLVLGYHNVVPDDAAPVGERALHIPRRRFAEQLDCLEEMADVVPLAELFATADARTRPSVVITFDDGYAGALTLGARELRERGFAATFFVAPGLLGGRSFWWDDVLPQDVGNLPRTVREAFIEECAGLDDRVRVREALPLEPGRMPPWARSATTTELRVAIEGSPFTLAAHTWDHPNLTALRADELEAQLARPLAWLHEHFAESALPWLSYPYGRHSEAVRKGAHAAGYQGAFRIEGGWLPHDACPGFALPRLNVPAGLSLDGFAIRLAGLLCH